MPDQNEHHQAHAFLAVVGTVREADARCRSGRGCRESTTAAAFFGSGCGIKFRLVHQSLEQQEKQRGADEADHG